MRRRTRLIAVVLVLTALLVGLYLTVGDRVSRASLSHSVAARVGPSYFASCRAGSAHDWTCQVMPSDASVTGIVYAVTVSGRCWQGSRVASAGLVGLPPRISGCVGPIDQLRPSDHLGGAGVRRRPGFY